MQKLHLLRKGVPEYLLSGVQEPGGQHLFFCSIFGHVIVKREGKFSRAFNTTSKITGKPQMKLSSGHELNTKKEASDLTSDPS